MRDIGNVLNTIMQTENCSPVCALFMLTVRSDNNGIRELQSESSKKIGGRLCDTGNIKVSE